MARYARADYAKSYQVLHQVESQEDDDEAFRRQGFALGLLRWWAMTTNPEFLISGANRRDLWMVLLPLPGLLNMFADRASSMLLLLDCAATVALIAASWLPAAALWSDLTISAVHAAHVVTYVAIAVESGPYFTVPSTLATCAMAFAGVNTLVLGSFVVVVSTVSTIQDFPWAPEQVLCCACIVFMSGAAEYRVARLFRELQRQQGAPRCGGGLESGAAPSPSPSGAVDMRDFVPSRPASLQHAPTRPASLQLPQPQQQERRPAVPPLQAEGDPAGSRLAHPLRQHRRLDMPPAASHEAPEFLEDEGDWQSRQPAGRPLQPENKPSPSPPSPARPLAAAQPPWDLGALAPQAPAWSPRQAEQPALKKAPAKAFTSIGVQPTGNGALPSEEEDGPGIAATSTVELLGSRDVQLPQSCADKATLRALKLQGFHRVELNQLFIENQDHGRLVNGRETYWASDGSYFLFFSQATKTWGLAKNDRLDEVRKGSHDGIALAPEGQELWTPCMAPLRGWREWDGDASKWIFRLGAGVESRGKVRPKLSGESRATQTERRRLLDKSVQTGE